MHKSCYTIKRIVTISIPIQYSDIIVLNDKGDNITQNCMYSWSTDNVCYTEFTTLQNYKLICKNIEGDFYLRILIYENIGKIILGNTEISCYSIYLYNENPYLSEPCDNTTIDFYAGMDCAIQMQTYLSDKIVCMFGIPCYYFRVTPNEDTKDLTFKEYVLHNISEIKSIKLMLQDGQLPSSKPIFTEFDFDWDNDWEVEISKTHFANAFGNEAFPKQRDIIYVPLLKRMYEVNSAYSENAEALMWRGTTWKLGLIKWNEKTNIDYSGFEHIIDDWAENQYSDVFSNELHEQEIESGITQQYTPTINQNNIKLYLSDAIRHSASSTSTIDIELHSGSVVVAKNMYKFQQPNDYVKYIKSICGDNGTISFIVSTNNINTGIAFDKKPILSFGEVVINYEVNDDKIILADNTGNTITLDTSSIYAVLYRWNRNTFTTEFTAFKHELGERFNNLPPYKLRNDMYSFVNKGTNVGVYNNDYSMQYPHECVIMPYPLNMCNIKYYDIYLDIADASKEILKYSTKHENCIFNDVCIPIEQGYGSVNR